MHSAYPAMRSYHIEQGGQRISEGIKQGDMLEVEAGNKLTEFGRKKQSEKRKDSVTLLKKGKNYRLRSWT